MLLYSHSVNIHCSESITKWLSAICFRGNSYRRTEWGMISIILRIHNGNIKERRCRLILWPPMMPLFAKEFWPHWPVNKCVWSYCTMTQDKSAFSSRQTALKGQSIQNDNSVNIFSPSYRSKPVWISFFHGIQQEKSWWAAWFFGFLLCSTENITANGYVPTWGCVNDGELL